MLSHYLSMLSSEFIEASGDLTCQAPMHLYSHSGAFPITRL
jgi:hypothetical protein